MMVDSEQVNVQTRVGEVLAPLVARRLEIQRRQSDEGSYPGEFWQALAEAGVLGGMIPQAYGGSGIGALGVAVALEESAALDVGNFLPVLTSLAAMAVARHGGDGLKKAVLPEIAAGRMRVGFAATERAAGFNVFRTALTAARSGDDYVLNGEKRLISAVDVADRLLVLARTQSAEDAVREGLGKTYGLSLFLVDTGAAGLSRREMETGTAGGVLRQYELAFDAVRVPAMQLVGPEHGGALPLLTCINLERVLTAALAVGISRHCLDVACEHARTRSIFGSTPIGRYQAVQHPLAEVRIRQEALRLLVHEAARKIDRDDGGQDAGLAANAAKFLGGELAVKAVDAAIDALGGRGFEEETGMMRLWQAARLMQTSPISDALVLNFVAEHNLALPRSS